MLKALAPRSFSTSFFLPSPHCQAWRVWPSQTIFLSKVTTPRRGSLPPKGILPFSARSAHSSAFISSILATFIPWGFRGFVDANLPPPTPLILIPVVINPYVAGYICPVPDPLGRHITILGEKQLEVVGIVGNVLNNGLPEPVQAESYLPFAQNPSSYVGLAIRSKGDRAALFSAVRNIVAELDPELPVHDMRPMEQVVAETLATRRLTLWLVGAFGALALVLSFVGIYGVMSYAVTERVHEIGVRTALGAARRDIFRLVMGSGMRLAGIGVA